MELDEIKTADHLREYCNHKLEIRGRDTYVCPVCGSGNGNKHTAAFHIYADHWKCFSCNAGGDLLDLIGAVEGLEGFNDRAERAAEFCGAEVGTTVKVRGSNTKPEVKAYVPKTDHAEGRRIEAARVAEFVAAYPDSPAEAYARERGIADYPLTYGYDARRQRLVIRWPTCDWYHIDRDITDGHRNKYEKPRQDAVGHQPTFTTGVADAPSFVVVEGAIDAGALMALGVENVVALCGTAYRDLLNRLTSDNYQGGVVVMLDNDTAGEASSTRFIGELEGAGIAALRFAWAEGDGKDADETIRAGRGEDLKARVGAALATAEGMARDREPSPSVRLVDPFEVAERIFLEDDADTPIPTGIASLDRVIGGGLMPALYVIGATSSFGKTTISVQVADHIAKGRPVLFVTIEQSCKEIVAKSLSRHTHDPHNSVGGGLTALEITTRTARAAWGQDRHAMLTEAIGRYTDETAPRLRILEGVTKPSVDEVRQAARAMQAEFGEPPVIFLDYLQLLRPADDRMTDKQAVDHNVTALRILARDLKTPVWCVATLNRESYSGPVDLDSFKESGSIEYGCDYAFGLQPQGIADEVRGVKSAVEKKLKGNAFIAKAKRDNPRKVELTVLKNRQGETTGSDAGIPLTYYPRTNIFI